MGGPRFRGQASVTSQSQGLLPRRPASQNYSDSIGVDDLVSRAFSEPRSLSRGHGISGRDEVPSPACEIGTRGFAFKKFPLDSGISDGFSSGRQDHGYAIRVRYRWKFRHFRSSQMLASEPRPPILNSQFKICLGGSQDRSAYAHRRQLKENYRFTTESQDTEGLRA